MVSNRPFKLELIQLSCLFFCLANIANSYGDTLSTPATIIEADEEFAHLLNRVASSKRVHLISELTRNGHRLQLEEFLDLESWNQLLQFKWHEDEKLGNGESQVLSTKKINILILNGGTKTVMVQYEPYSCSLAAYDTNSSMSADADWWLTVEDCMAMKSDNIDIKPRHRHSATIDSIISRSPNSPYFARVPIGSDAEAWSFGIAGLWIKAQFPGLSHAVPAKVFHLENEVKIKDSDGWRLDLGRSNIMYYFNTAFVGYNNDHKLLSGSKSNAGYDILNFIELRNSKSTQLIDIINVIDVDINLSDQLVRDLFKLPIGYGCPANPTLTVSDIYFEGPVTLALSLREFETVATRYDDTSTYSSTDVKSLTIASSKHPIDPNSSLTLFHILEDRLKLIRDFNSQIIYQIYSNGSSTSRCTISRLHIYDFKHHQATEHVVVSYHNGITISLNEMFVEYLLSSKRSLGDEQQYLNLINVGQLNKEELVFESKVPDSYVELLQVIDKQRGEAIQRSISLVRVYERTYSIDKNNIRHRQQSPRLIRIMLLVYDHARQQKLAEVRFNLIETVRPLSFARRAQLFDVSQCHSDKDTTELVVTYAADKRLVEYAKSRSHGLVNEFYLSSINWGLVGDSAANDTLIREKQRLGVSLNYLRVPKVELLSSEGGKLKLKLSILDKVSPIHLFDQIIESTFVTNAMDEKLLVASEVECADFCRLHNCRLFAFDKSTLECRLSPISVEDQVSDGDEDNDASGSDQYPVTVVRKVSSTIYYAPARPESTDISKGGSFDEATLAELHSYLEHNAGELNMEPDDEEASDKNDEYFERDASLNWQSESIKDASEKPLCSWPLLSFQFTDRSDPNRKYGPPTKRLLVPSEIKVSRVPSTIDVSQESQRIKMASAFSTRFTDKNFQLNLLDNPAWTPQSIFISDERTFFDPFNNTYYIFRRLHLIDIDTCSLMCHNIDQSDAIANAEQICQSFSYCAKRKDCTLVVKTDGNYTEILDLINEGDRLLDINSTDELQVDEPGCIISARNNLAEFEGPIRLPPGVFGNNSMPYIHSIHTSNNIKYGWVSAFNIESSGIYEDSQDNCAKECNQLNRVGNKMCVALDFCVTKLQPDFKDHKAIIKYQTNCNLLIILGDQNPSGSQSMILSNLRQQLIQPTIMGITKSEKDKLDSTCNRYLVSHLSQFNHIKARKASQELIEQLKRPIVAPMVKNLNLDNCALECFVRQNECLVFEYCSKFDDRTRLPQMNCSLFGGPKVSAENSPTAKSTSKRKSDSTGQLSTYNRDCHIYLRKEFKSLHDLLGSTPKHSPETTFKYWKLIGYCVILFIFYLIVALICYKSISDHRKSC